MSDYNDPKIIEDAVRSPLFFHARLRPWCGVNLVHIYHFDLKSPTGVHSVCAGEEHIVDPIIRRIQSTSALSPTEGFDA